VFLLMLAFGEAKYQAGKPKISPELRRLYPDRAA
jgi:hypothetical protein